MWHPKQLLHKETVTSLLMGGLTAIEIEFLGWLSYNASALNNSRNPVLAAHTILAKANDPDSKMRKMLLRFKYRKIESVTPSKIPDHDAADKVFDDLRWAEKKALDIGMISSSGEDFTKGGISDGPDSVEADDKELSEGAAE